MNRRGFLGALLTPLLIKTKPKPKPRWRSNSYGPIRMNKLKVWPCNMGETKYAVK